MSKHPPADPSNDLQNHDGRPSGFEKNLAAFPARHPPMRYGQEGKACERETQSATAGHRRTRGKRQQRDMLGHARLAGAATWWECWSALSRVLSLGTRSFRRQSVCCVPATAGDGSVEPPAAFQRGRLHRAKAQCATLGSRHSGGAGRHGREKAHGAWARLQVRTLLSLLPPALGKSYRVCSQLTSH